MKKKPLPKIQVRVFGTYVNKQGKKRKGFVKYDGRKKQTIYIRDKESGKSYKIQDKLGTKKKFKNFKLQASRYIKKSYKTFKGIKIYSHKPKLRMKKVDFVVSKTFEKPYDKDHKRVETIQYMETIPAAKNLFYAAFQYARETKASIVIPVIKIEITFEKRKNYSYTADWFIYARRNDANLNMETIESVWNEIRKSLEDKFEELNASYKPKTAQIYFYITWLYPK